MLLFYYAFFFKVLTTLLDVSHHMSQSIVIIIIIFLISSIVIILSRVGYTLLGLLCRKSDMRIFIVMISKDSKDGAHARVEKDTKLLLS